MAPTRDSRGAVKIHSSPDVWLIEEFLTPSECDALVEESRARLRRSRIGVPLAAGDSALSDARKSQVGHFSPGNSRGFPSPPARPTATPQRRDAKILEYLVGNKSQHYSHASLWLCHRHVTLIVPCKSAHLVRGGGLAAQSALEARASRLLGVPLERFESLQAMSPLTR